MKKQILVLAALFAGSASFAQVTTLKNKKGFEILPQAGDYAISVDATPILDFGLNAIKMGVNTGATAGHPGYVSGAFRTVVGKYFITANTAYRVKLGINYITNNNDNVLGTTAGGNEYIQTVKTKTSNIILGGGMEWRRGHNRLQGFYGAEALINIGSPSAISKNEYNMTLKEAYDSVTPVNSVTTRSLGITKSSAFGITVRGFVGVEYFVLPKISLGAEFGWGLGYQASKGTRTRETMNGPGTESTETESQASRNSGIRIGTDLGAGAASLTATFHF